MKLRGGYNIKIQGSPDGLLKKVSTPDILFYPLMSGRFNYSQLNVAHGQHVKMGHVLAKDPEHYDIPLLSSYGGMVDLKSEEGHIVLKDLSYDDAKEYVYKDEQEQIHKKMGSAELKRYKLLNLGAWEYVLDAYTNQIPDPLSMPQAVIISTLRLEPFLVRGDVLLKAYLRQFTRGIEHLQSLLEYQPIYLVLPKLTAKLATKIKEQIRGYAWVKIVEVPLKYPYDNFEILSRHIGLKRSEGLVWGINVDGVLAVDTVLTSSRPCVDRIISVGGPGSNNPSNLHLTAGYPIEHIKTDYAQDAMIAVNGGILTGQHITQDVKGVPADCKGITFVPEQQSREFLAFVRPGFDRQSYSACFMSALRKCFPERMTNAVRGELRPCVSCNFCEEVCPAGIIPHRLHKLIYQDDIDAIEKFRIDLCVECGLCSFVCPSKIELMQQFQEAKETILNEKAAAAEEKASEQDAETE